jgi:non-lysosomal glucosylceramidase
VVTLDRWIYEGERLKEISFPLGGIGSGSIGLAGSGRLVDWELFNRPNKGSVNGYSHFAVRAERGGKVVDARVLNGPFLGAAAGDYTGLPFRSYGFGARREYLVGLPHFATCRFDGRFPVAEISFVDERFPGAAKLTAFNPLIPMEGDASSLPAAFFEVEIENTDDAPLDYTVIGVLGNPLTAEARSAPAKGTGWTGARHETKGLPSDDVERGALLLATDADEVSVQRHLFRGAWFDMLEVYWSDVLAGGRFTDRSYGDGRPSREADHTLVAAHFALAPGERRTVRFLVGWHVPNCRKYWVSNNGLRAPAKPVGEVWQNYYATLFPDVDAVAETAFANWSKWRGETFRFRDVFYAQTLPPAVLDAAGANISILKSSTVLRLEDGTFYGWEGVHPDAGSCEGSCTHVWNYQQTLPFLFPALERSMREADFRYNQDPATGGMAFRLQLPLGIGISDVRPCADGQFGNVLKVYRDWKISGDTAWLEAFWPAVKAAIAFAWDPGNPDQWDPDKSGVLTGRQHHTLDMELYGANSWLNGFYLGALKAGAEMATALGDDAAAEEYQAIYERGRAWTNEHLFSGTHFIQRIDISDRNQLDRFASGPDTIVAGSIYDLYWSDEHRQVKYQVGEGCIIDQVLGQWHAGLYGLGDLFDHDKTETALRTIMANNFKARLGDVYNPCRVYGFEDEAGTLICTWPEGTTKPAIPVPYAQESMHGFEYAFGATLMQYGLLEDGVKVFDAVRDRYDGSSRNPWNEIECGSNYSRSMAAYAGLLVLSGFSFDATRGHLGFDPKVRSGDQVDLFWAIEGAWGRFKLRDGSAAIEVLGGKLELRRLGLPIPAGAAVRLCGPAGDSLAAEVEAGGVVVPVLPISIGAGQQLTVSSEALTVARLTETSGLQA